MSKREYVTNGLVASGGRGHIRGWAESRRRGQEVTTCTAM